MSQQSDPFMLRGGLDMTTPALAIEPGRLLTALNYYPVDRGYQRGSQYERYDGRRAPSSADFLYLPFKEREIEIEAGDIITGADAAAVVLAVVYSESEPFLANEDDILANTEEYDANETVIESATTGYMIVVQTVGAFATDDTFSIEGVVAAQAAAGQLLNYAPTLALEQEYRALAADVIRQDILVPPGEGPVRGVQWFDGHLYAFRNQPANGPCKMYRDSPNGWVEMDLGNTIAFTAGTLEFQEGETLSRGGVTATIRRVVVTAGSWAADNAGGYLSISGASGTFTAGIGTSASGSATLNAAQIPNVLPRAWGANQFSFAINNFKGISGTECMYFTYGRGRSYEWDGDNLTPIHAPLSADLDKPVLVAAFSNHLFLFYQSGTMLFSEIGNPLAWTTTGGAGEIALGSFPRAVLEAAQTAMMIICRTKILYLAGHDAADFTLKELSDEAGGWASTAQNITRPVYLDQRGLREMAATSTSAGFRVGTMSDPIAPVFETLEKAGQRPWCSAISGVGSLMFIFCNDTQDSEDGWVDSPALNQTGIVAFFGRKYAEFTQLEIPAKVWSACSVGAGEEDVTQERIFLGGADGMVYELGKGTSHDGVAIEAFVRLPFNMVRLPQINKRFHSADVDVDAEGETEFAVSSDFNFGSGERPTGPSARGIVVGGGGYWSETNWSEFSWGAPSNGVLRQRIDGAGQSCSIGIYSQSRAAPAHTLTAMRVNWSQRGFRR